jgi:hypothetical protein
LFGWIPEVRKIGGFNTDNLPQGRGLPLLMQGESWEVDPNWAEDLRQRQMQIYALTRIGHPIPAILIRPARRSWGWMCAEAKAGLNPGCQAAESHIICCEVSQNRTFVEMHFYYA